jgi:hypothetical protein
MHGQPTENGSVRRREYSLAGALASTPGRPAPGRIGVNTAPIGYRRAAMVQVSETRRDERGRACIR